MPAPGELSLGEIRVLTKQALANQTGGLMTDDWYNDRINSALARLCSFQGAVQAPGMRRPQFRVLRFFELYQYDDQTLAIADYTTTNFTVPATTNEIVYVDNLYDLTNSRPLKRRALRYMDTLNPQQGGIPLRWTPAGKGQPGYLIHPIPDEAGHVISVRERTYQYPQALSTDNAIPGIPANWHEAIVYAAAAEGASKIDWPEKSAELEQKFITFVAQHRSPVEEAGAAGGRRHFTIGGI